MLKNRILLVCLFLSLAKGGIAQNGVVTAENLLIINEAALIQGNATTGQITDYYYVQGTSNSWNDLWVGLRAEPMSNREIPLDKFTGTVTWKGQVIKTFILSTGGQIIFYESERRGSGSFVMKYSAENLSSFGWIAGNYSIRVNTYRNQPAFQGWADITPNPKILNIEVKSFISDLSSVDNFDLRINDFAFYRGKGASVSISSAYRATVPFDLRLRGLNNVFKFENGANGVAAPVTTLGRIKAELIIKGSAPLGLNVLSTSEKIIGAVPSVPIGNKSYMDLKFSISPEDLKTGFINKGTYANSLNLEGREIPRAGSSSSVTTKKDFWLNIIVDDMFELAVNQQNINFVFGTVQDYQNGIVIEIPNHLTVSKTTPFDITVRAETANFSSGSGTIPVGVLKVGPAAAEKNVNNLGSITDVNQTLVSASPPAIDKNFSVKYHIPKTETEKLITSKSGSYSVNLIYTLTTH